MMHLDINLKELSLKRIDGKILMIAGTILACVIMIVLMIHGIGMLKDNDASRRKAVLELEENTARLVRLERMNQNKDEIMSAFRNYQLMLPSGIAQNAFLESVQELGNAHSVKIESVMFGDTSANSVTKQQLVNISAGGEYQDVMSFFDEMTTEGRVVMLNSFSINGDRSGGVSAEAEIYACYR